MIARRIPPAEVLDAVLQHERTASSRHRPALIRYRLWALEMLGRPDEELAAAVEEFIEAARADLLIEIAPAVIGNCASRPALAQRHVVPLIAQLEALPGQGQTPLKETLAMARQVCQRLGVSV